VAAIKLPAKTVAIPTRENPLIIWSPKLCG
jgi:hypothetical protein